MGKTKEPVTPYLENLGSLITYKLEQGGEDHLLGSLMDFRERGVFDATFGKVPVTPEQAEIHNRLLDEALVEGLDNRCEVGQGGQFYMHGTPDSTLTLCVKTFTGTVVADYTDIGVKPFRGKKTVFDVEFDRKGKTFRGRWTPAEQDLTFFVRVS
jgi:hypothetical protein